MPNQMVSNFGGLSFANNKLDFADPAYDTINAATADMANTWATNKAAYEKVADFITGQSVLDKDVQLKQGTANKFTEGIKSYVDRGNYEQASRELDKSIRDFNNNKGFQMAVGNYAAFTEFAQKQRDQIGYDEDTKNRYIAAIHSQYQGVKVHEDGSVSGTFQGRDMGEYVDIQQELAKELANFRETKTAQLSSNKLGVVGQSIDTNKLTKEFIDENAFIAHSKFLIENNPKFKHFFDTMAIADSTRSVNEIAASVDRRAGSSVSNAQNMNATYKALQRAATTPKGKAELAEFETKYKDGNGNLRADLYTLDFMLTDRGLFKTDDKRSVEAKKEFMNNALSARADYLAKGGTVEDAVKRYQTAIESNVKPDATDALVVFANQAEATLRDVNNTLFKEEHAYQSFLPHAGVKTDWTHYSTYTDEYYTKRLEEDAKNRAIPALVTESTSRPAEFSFLFEGTENGKYSGDAVPLYQNKVDEYKNNFVENGNKLAKSIIWLNSVISDYKVKNEEEGKKLKLVGAPPANIMTANPDEFGKLDDVTLQFLKDNYPAQYQSYRQQYNDYRSQHNSYNNANNLLAQAQEYAQRANPEYDGMRKTLKAYDDIELKLHKDLERAKNKHDKMAIAIELDKIIAKKAKYAKEVEVGAKRNYDSNVHEYLATHATAGFTVGEMSVEGIRNLDTKYGKEIDAISKDVEAIMIENLLKADSPYSVYTGKSKIYNNTGAHVNGDGFDNHDIKKIRLVGITTNGLTENPVYKFAILDPNQKEGNVGGTIGMIEYEDANDNLGQYRQRLSAPVFNGEVDADAKTAKFLDELDAINMTRGAINMPTVTSQLLNTGSAEIKFNFNDGFDVVGGRVTKEYADFTTPAGINVDKSNFVLKYRYKDASEKEVTAEFKDMLELRKFAINQYNEILSNLQKAKLRVN